MTPLTLQSGTHGCASGTLPTSNYSSQTRIIRTGTPYSRCCGVFSLLQYRCKKCSAVGKKQRATANRFGFTLGGSNCTVWLKHVLRDLLADWRKLSRRLPSKFFVMLQGDNGYPGFPAACHADNMARGDIHGKCAQNELGSPTALNHPQYELIRRFFFRRLWDTSRSAKTTSCIKLRIYSFFSVLLG